MQHWLIENHIHCRRMLAYGYDTVGSNPLNGNENSILKGAGKGSVRGSSMHYSGNFWWSTASHLARLTKELPIDEHMQVRRRLQAENLVLSAYPSMCAGVVYDWGSPHMYHLSEIPHVHNLSITSARCDIL